MGIILEYKSVNKSFGEKEVLKDVNLQIGSGKIIGLLGKNGSGKTTIIKMINDLLTLDSGEILVNGSKIGVESKKVISYLPERSYLEGSERVIDIIKLFKDFSAYFARHTTARINYLNFYVFIFTFKSYINLPSVRGKLDSVRN